MIASHQNTVLVVDDTPDSLRFLTDTLEHTGISVLIAASGDAALELLDHIAPDLILMDAVMPGLDGFETTRAIKQRPLSKSIPVIFMTGLTDSEHVVQALEAGAVDYVRKPILVDELVARVRVHMANARHARHSRFALDATGRNLVATTATGQLSWSTPGADLLMEALDPAWREGLLPPAPLRPAFARLIGDDLPAGSATKVETGLGHTIELIVVGRPRRDETLIRLNRLDAKIDVRRLQCHFGLTLREAEVLLWVSYGKPNRVISEILAISPRTVNKHLEQVFQKLGAETRSAAAAFAVRAIAQ